MSIEQGKEACVIEIEDDEEISLVDVLAQEPVPGSAPIEN